MADVLVSMKIYPSDVNVDLELVKRKIKENLPEYASIYRFDEEPIAFGLVAIIAHIILPENRSGGIDEIESCLQKIEEVSQFETQMVRRI